jgi:glycosyltransferase involved in cell wall biosynthesis
MLGRAVAAKLGIPAVHTVHGASFHYGQNPVLHRAYIAAEKWAARRTARFISVCDAMTEQYVRAGIAPREKFTTIYSGMEVEPFLHPPRPRETVRRELDFAPEHVVIGKVGRLFHLKGHEFVIAAASAVAARHPQVRFLFIGDGILREQYLADIARAGLTDKFVFTGLVPPERIPELIHACDIVAHTSLWEGLARVLPQALIAGKPVVSYDVDGAREVAIPGETGYLLPPQSVTELAEALCELIADPAKRERFGRTGRERFTDQFRHETMTRRIREVYAELLGR